MFFVENLLFTQTQSGITEQLGTYTPTRSFIANLPRESGVSGPVDHFHTLSTGVYLYQFAVVYIYIPLHTTKCFTAYYNIGILQEAESEAERL